VNFTDHELLITVFEDLLKDINCTPLLEDQHGPTHHYAVAIGTNEDILVSHDAAVRLRADGLPEYGVYGRVAKIILDTNDLSLKVTKGEHKATILLADPNASEQLRAVLFDEHQDK
jgi:hypothetical protein